MFEEKLPQFSELECGYLEKGANCWIKDYEDVKAIYKTFSSTKEITIWCEGRLSEEQVKKKGGGKKKTGRN